MDKLKEIVNFIRQAFNEPEAFIPLHEPRFIGNEKKYLNECIDSTFVSSVGKFVDLFEDITAKYTGSKHAVVCVNGTEALHMALMLAGVKRNEEVITQPLTFIATANAISYAGASPVFIDVDRDTLGLSPSALGSFLDEYADVGNDGFTYNKKTGKRIAACLPVHIFGHPCRIDEIVGICNTYNIPVIEDAAESIGSLYKGQHTGTFGKLGILSYNGNKTITTGGGGMILTDDEVLGKMAKHLTTQAKVPHPYEYVHDHIGYNYRMPNLNAALGVAQMESVDFFIRKKRELAEAYKSFFDSIGVSFFTEPENAFSNYWLNAIILDSREERDRFLEYSNHKNVMTRPAWRLMNKLPMFTDCLVYSIDNAYWLEDRIVNVPSSVIF
ncbi:MAG: LegC family aminotransferase [Bacteroidales bacterium]|nr:LegC family aminotransferase [Bacteroidales bacterium]